MIEQTRRPRLLDFSIAMVSIFGFQAMTQFIVVIFPESIEHLWLAHNLAVERFRDTIHTLASYLGASHFIGLAVAVAAASAICLSIRNSRRTRLSSLALSFAWVMLAGSMLLVAGLQIDGAVEMARCHCVI